MKTIKSILRCKVLREAIVSIPPTPQSLRDSSPPFGKASPREGSLFWEQKDGLDLATGIAKAMAQFLMCGMDSGLFCQGVLASYQFLTLYPQLCLPERAPL